VHLPFLATTLKSVFLDLKLATAVFWLTPVFLPFVQDAKHFEFLVRYPLLHLKITHHSKCFTQILRFFWRLILSSHLYISQKAITLLIYRIKSRDRELLRKLLLQFLLAYAKFHAQLIRFLFF
jgi:hypothetical protein